MIRTRAIISAAAAALLLVACGDNVGRLFDPDVTGPGGGTASTVQVVPIGGTVADGRPSVVDAFPKGGGWPTTVPIVVVFSESLNETSAVPADPQVAERVFVRAANTDVVVPASYDFLLGGTVVVIRPSAPLVTPPGGSFEVVVDPELRDADGTRFGTPEPEVVATFTTDLPETEVDGEILTTLPIDNSSSQLRETPIYLILTRPATPDIVTTSNFVVRTAGGTVVAGAVDTPIALTPELDDTRIVRFVPNDVLAASVNYEIVVDATITFPQGGVLDFAGRRPFATFATQAPAAPTSVAVGNLTAGFPDAINRNNLANLQIDVAVGADAQRGDRLVVRLYGLDPAAQPVNAERVLFVERDIELPADGAQTVSVDFSGALGSVDAPRFADGSIALRAQLRRGRRQSGFIRSDTAVSPRFDVTPPSIVAFGPPSDPTTMTDVLTDQEYLVLYGTASEEISSAAFALGGANPTLFAAANDGRFVTLPGFVGARAGVGLDYDLTLTDAAGNMTTAAIAGTVRQRGVVADPLAGTLVVEAYDDATLLPIAGATVVIEPGQPSKPASGRMEATTDAAGRAVFAGLTGARYTSTVVAAGYDLVTLLDSPAAFVSLPLRPRDGDRATATLTGTLIAAPALVTGESGLLGTNVFADRTIEAVATGTTAPTLLPPTAIRPNRPIVANVLVGVFPPVSTAAISRLACGLCGTDTSTPTPPFAPVPPGATGTIALALTPSTAASVRSQSQVFAIDFAAAAGLGAPVGAPSVRVVQSLQGFGGMSLIGVGFATSTSGAAYSVQSSYALIVPAALAGFTPTAFVSIEATDAAGNASRTRALLSNVLAGDVAPPAPVPGIPTIAAPLGSVVGAPAISFEDRLDGSAIVGGFAMREIRATDRSGRRWVVLEHDVDAAVGSKTRQLPDLTGSSAIGLGAGGDWIVQIEDQLAFAATYTPTSYVLEERYRQLVTCARAAAVAFTVD